jgi:hypothetical protein
MSHAHGVRHDPVRESQRSAPRHHPIPAIPKRRVPPFWRHFLEMLAVMIAGMFVTGAVFVSVVGIKTWNEITIVYPTQALLAMGVGMSLRMVGWMLFRGMGRKNTYEMALAMMLPVIPFLCLVWFGITKTAQCGAYCAATVVVMLVLIRYRRSEYSMQM